MVEFFVQNLDSIDEVSGELEYRGEYDEAGSIYVSGGKGRIHLEDKELTEGTTAIEIFRDKQATVCQETVDMTARDKLRRLLDSLTNDQSKRVLQLLSSCPDFRDLPALQPDPATEPQEIVNPVTELHLENDSFRIEDGTFKWSHHTNTRWFPLNGPATISQSGHVVGGSDIKSGVLVLVQSTDFWYMLISQNESKRRVGYWFAFPAGSITSPVKLVVEKYDRVTIDSGPGNWRFFSFYYGWSYTPTAGAKAQRPKACLVKCTYE